MSITDRYAYAKWYVVRYARCARTHIAINGYYLRKSIAAKIDRVTHRLYGITPPR